MAHELLVSCAWKGTLILLAAGLADLILRKASAAVRSVVWSVAFLALLMLPALSISLPRRPSPPMRTAEAPVRSTSVPSPAGAQQPGGGAPQDWALVVWLCGSTLVIARLGVGTARVWALARRAQPMELGEFGRRVPVLDAGSGATPLAWGWLRPVILLPSEARDWPASRLRSVLLQDAGDLRTCTCALLVSSIGVVGGGASAPRARTGL
jgi:hypothetical protein